LSWPNIVDGKTTYDMSHLDTFGSTESVGELTFEVVYSFHPHTFADEKARGVRLPFGKDERYFSKDRWEASHEVAHFMRSGKFSSGYVKAFLSWNDDEQFFSLDLEHIAVFVAIQKSNHLANTLNCRVISSYPVNGSNFYKLPKGKLYKVSTVYSRRITGQLIAL
jgi:hypothetical protein